MKKLILIISITLFSCNLFAQGFKVGIGYDYLYSNQWDKAIQTYNFSRPFITEKQPLLMHGLNASISYIFKSTKKFKHGINFSYSYFRSSAANENLENTLNLHFINLGYTLHYENAEKLKGFYSDLTISALLGGLFRNINGEQFLIDDIRAKALGIGGDINLKAGYKIKTKGKLSISPFITVGYSPYFYSPKTESIINQTKGLSSNNWTGILKAQAGVALHFNRQ